MPVLEGTEEDEGVVAWVHPAHAALFAAAPELYEALRELHDYLREHGSARDTLAMLTRSHAALGKAVGER